MRVLLVHNHYQQLGGEDGVFAAEGRLLEAHGHQVTRYTAHNAQVTTLGSAALARATVWNQSTVHAMRQLIRRERPDVMHVHNTLPLISPAVYYAAHEAGVPVVQTLHNYRLLCPGATFYRNGTVCEDCLGKRVPYPGVMHRCYRGSLAASAAVAATLSVHRALGTWTRQVDLFLALTEFARCKFVEGGLPCESVAVKPNFVDPDPGVGTGDGEYALFVGRLTPEKGVRTLLAAWEHGGAALPLRVAGDGPLAGEVAAAAARSPTIEWLGRQSPESVAGLMSRATVLVCPSEWYEGFPLTIVEAFAAGLPIVAAAIGSLGALVEEGATGLHFPAGDAAVLATRIEWVATHSAELATMRRRAREQYEAHYTAKRNYDLLMQVYERAAVRARARAQ